jgi:hypothetical protein
LLIILKKILIIGVSNTRPREGKVGRPSHKHVREVIGSTFVRIFRLRGHAEEDETVERA